MTDPRYPSFADSFFNNQPYFLDTRVLTEALTPGYRRPRWFLALARTKQQKVLQAVKECITTCNTLPNLSTFAQHKKSLKNNIDLDYFENLSFSKNSTGFIFLKDSTIYRAAIQKMIRKFNELKGKMIINN